MNAKVGSSNFGIRMNMQAGHITVHKYYTEYRIEYLIGTVSKTIQHRKIAHC